METWGDRERVSDVRPESTAHSERSATLGECPVTGEIQPDQEGPAEKV